MSTLCEPRRKEWVVPIALLAASALAVALSYESLRDHLAWKARCRQLDWVNEQRAMALEDADHLRWLSRFAYDGATTEWERRNARSIVASLVRLPGESTDSIDDGPSSARWDQIRRFLEDPATSLTLDDRVGAWFISLPQNAQAGD